MTWGVVLAGGRSTRMGRDKASLPVAPGVRLVDRVVAAVGAALREAGEPGARVLVSGEVAGHECVPDGAPGLGPVAGIAAALARLTDGDRALLVPVDLPALAPAALLPLLAAAAPAAYEGSALPALLAADPRTRAAVAEVLASPGRDRSVTRLLALLGARALPLDPAHAPLLAGANTPGELAALLSPAVNGDPP